MIVKSWLWLVVAGIAFVLFGCGLIGAVMLLIRGNRGDVMNTSPLVPEQTVDLRTTGEVVLQIEVPRTATDFRRFRYEVVEPETGRVNAMTLGRVRTSGTVYGITTMKVPVGRVLVSRAGKYTVRVDGMEDGKDYSNYRLLISRPYIARMVIQILGIVLGGVGMLLSLLWGLWLLGVLKAS